MSLRVLHLIPSISPRRGGPSQAVLAMSSALRQKGVDAAILTTDDDGPDRLPIPIGQWHEREGVPVLAFPRWSPAARPLRPLREFALSPALLRWLRRNVREWELLHVHALFSFPSTAGMAVARRQGVPYVLRTIGQLQRWSLQQSAGRKRLLLRLIERRNLGGAAALHFTSEAEQREAAALGLATPSFVLPLGVELPPGAEPAGVLGPVRFLFLSRLHPKKQLPVLLEALAELRRRHPGAAWQLDVAGEGEPAYVIELQQQAERLAIADRVRWHGFVAGEAKAALLHRADWFVLPSAAENFGIAAAEALAAGVPAILSPGVALAAVVAETGAGLVCEPTPQNLTAALEACLHPPPACMRRAARQLAVEHFSWEVIGGQLVDQYSQLVQAAPAGHIC
ncbi:MAG: glycosyltransferase [Cyanobacteria bacterium J06638_7]